MIDRLIKLFQWRVANEPEFRLDRRQFLRFSGMIAALPVIPVAAEELIELLAPRPTILLPRSVGNVWAVNQLGGFFYSRELSKVFRQSVTPMIRFKQFADVPRIPLSRFTWDVYEDKALRFYGST